MIIVLLLCMFATKEPYACKRVFQHTNDFYVVVGVMLVLIVVAVFSVFKKIQQSNFMRNMMIVGNSVLFIIIRLLLKTIIALTSNPVQYLLPIRSLPVRTTGRSLMLPIAIIPLISFSRLLI